MFCHNCGEKIPEEGLFCANCGSMKLTQQTPDLTEEQLKTKNSYNDQSTNPTNKILSLKFHDFFIKSLMVSIILSSIILISNMIATIYEFELCTSYFSTYFIINIFLSFKIRKHLKNFDVLAYTYMSIYFFLIVLSVIFSGQSITHIILILLVMINVIYNIIIYYSARTSLFS